MRPYSDGSNPIYSTLGGSFGSFFGLAAGGAGSLGSIGLFLRPGPTLWSLGYKGVRVPKASAFL
ncbi:MAG: hypothetical protein GY772_09510 [bacterium]|nr:hypothetical protein [bacterium]